MTYQIVDILKNEWKLTRRSIERYLTYAYKFLKTDLNKEDKELVMLELRELERQYKLKGDAKSMIKLKEMRLKIAGYFSPTKMDITSNGETLKTSIIYIEKPDAK